MQSLKLLVADDHEIVRKGVRCLLEAQPGSQVMAEASNDREAVEEAKRLKPDVAVLDIGMPSLNGLEAARQMLKNDPHIKIVILTMHDADNLIREVLKVGARGYVSMRDLVSAINSVRSGGTFFTAKVAEVVLEGYLDKGEATNSRLTPRQREIIQLLAEGKSNKEIAVALCLSIKTAETHRANIMKRRNWITPARSSLSFVRTVSEVPFSVLPACQEGLV
jgi:two-component system, NarL family, response regulator NreC